MRLDKYRHLNQNCPDPTFDLSHVRDVVGRQAAVLSSVRLPTNTEGGLATAISYLEHRLLKPLLTTGLAICLWMYAADLWCQRFVLTQIPVGFTLKKKFDRSWWRCPFWNEGTPPSPGTWARAEPAREEQLLICSQPRSECW